MPLSMEQSDALAEVYARSLFELAEAQGGQATIESTAGELESPLATGLVHLMAPSCSETP